MDNGIWMPILEKAFAKYHGNYTNIIAGSPTYSIRTLSGAPYFIMDNFDDDGN